MIYRTMMSGCLVTAIGLTAGCGDTKAPTPSADHHTHSHQRGKKKDAHADSAAEIAAERAKLSAEDRHLVEAQEWCVVSNDEQLGSMGAPIKLTIKDQAVFICCKGCKKKAEADPDKTLAKLEELKAKKRAEKAK